MSESGRLLRDRYDVRSVVQRIDDVGQLDRPEVWSILVEGDMRTRSVVVSEVAGQDEAEVSLAEHEHVIQALAPN